MRRWLALLGILLMSVSVKTGSFNSGVASASDVVVTGVGFKPDLVILIWTRLTQATDGIQTSTTADACMGIGWMINDNADGAPTARRSCVSLSRDAAPTGGGACRMQNNAVYCELLVTGLMSGLLDGKSFDADGFTLAVDDNCSADARIHYFALKADTDITNIATGRSLPPTATGNLGYTGPGFQPDFVLFAGIRGTTENADLREGVLTLGAATSSTKRAVATVCTFDANTNMFTEGYGYDGEVMAFPLPAAVSPQTLEARADFVSFDANGFTLNWLEVPATNASQFMWLAIKGGQWDVFNDLTLTNTTTDIPITNGFQPKGGMVVGSLKAKSTQDVMTPHAGLSVGFWNSATSEGCFAINDEDGLGTSETSAAVEHDAVLQTITQTTHVQAGTMHVNSVDSDGVNFRMAVADAAQTFFWGWLRLECDHSLSTPCTGVDVETGSPVSVVVSSLVCVVPPQHDPTLDADAAYTRLSHRYHTL